MAKASTDCGRALAAQCAVHSQLEPAEAGLYRLNASWRQAVEQALPPSCRNAMGFLLSVEISSIYKKHGRTRKVHHLVMLPDLAYVEAFNRRLGTIGNSSPSS